MLRIGGRRWARGFGHSRVLWANQEDLFDQINFYAPDEEDIETEDVDQDTQAVLDEIRLEMEQEMEGAPFKDWSDEITKEEMKELPYALRSKAKKRAPTLSPTFPSLTSPTPTYQHNKLIPVDSPFRPRSLKSKGYLLPVKAKLSSVPKSLQLRIEYIAKHYYRKELLYQYREWKKNQHEQQPLGIDVKTATSILCYESGDHYIALERILEELRVLEPHYEPKSLLDIGSQMGIHIWCSKTVYPSLQRIYAIEPNESMIMNGKHILEGMNPVIWHKDMKGMGRSIKHDLIILYQQLDSEPLTRWYKKIQDIIQHHLLPNGKCIIVERGTTQGFERIRKVRDEVIVKRKDVQVVAPCLHQQGCPLANDKNVFCHIKQRALLTPLQLQLKKDASRNHKDVNYSYLVFTKGPTPEKEQEGWERLIQAPIKRGKHVILQTCGHNGGINRHVITKSMGPIYSDARKSIWGDMIDIPMQGTAKNLPKKHFLEANNKFTVD